jgi:hypothetical protein
MWREILRVFAYALDRAVDRSVTLKVRFDRVCLILDEETCQDADTLQKTSDDGISGKT